MPILETPPDSVQNTIRALSARNDASETDSFPARERAAALDSHPAPDSAPLLSLATDIGPDGMFGERWLVVDQTHVRVFTPAHHGQAAHVDLELPLRQLQAVRLDTLVGCGVLRLVTRDGRTLDALRYSPAQSAQFAAAARALESYFKDEEPPASLAESVAPKTCPRCGDPLPDDTNVCPKCVDKRAVLSRLLGYVLPYRGKAFLVSALMLLATAVSLAPPLFQKHLIDDVLIPHRHLGWIGLFVASLIGVGLLNIGLSIWRGRLAAWMSNHMVHTIRTQVYDRLQALSLGYYDKRQTGSLMARVTQDVNELQNFMVDGIQLFLVNTLTILGILAILLWNDWKLTLMLLVPVPVTMFLTKRIWEVLWRRLHRLWHLRSNLSATIGAALSGVRVVKAFSQEDKEAHRFREKSASLFEAGVLVEKSWATYFPILGFVTTAGVYIIWLVGGREVFHNHNPHHGMTLGVLTMFLAYVGMLMTPLQSMTRLADWLSRSTASAERVFEVLDAQPDVRDDAEAVSMPRVEGHVSLQNVRFSYDNNANVLDDVSIDVRPGEMIGLVGHSGAGKSTIINLLSRFYDVKDGSILIDGIDIRKIKMADLRRQVGVVLQEPFLFPGTISDNIAYARADATPVEIMRSAKAANAHDFVMRFPDGYDTWVGERGARLSGGERQRLSIARAILHDPRILILDEATASVDTETEKQIQEALARLTEGRTTFAIAHRLSTLRHASRLMVMEKGKMVELGTHAELLAKPEGVFRRLAAMQQQVNSLGSAPADLASALPDTSPAPDAPEESNPFDIRLLDPRQVRLFRAHSQDALARLTLDGDRSWREVRIARAFPFSDPGHYIGFRDGNDKDIGLLIDLQDLDAESRRIIEEELEARYFTPQVQRVVSAKEEYGVIRWDVETTRGPRRFFVRNLRDHSYPLGPNRLMMTDMNGSRYEFPDVASVSPSAYQILAKVI